MMGFNLKVVQGPHIISYLHPADIPGNSDLADLSG
jgi:hypothetical protein